MNKPPTFDIWMIVVKVISLTTGPFHLEDDDNVELKLTIYPQMTCEKVKVKANQLSHINHSFQIQESFRNIQKCGIAVRRTHFIGSDELIGVIAIHLDRTAKDTSVRQTRPLKNGPRPIQGANAEVEVTISDLISPDRLAGQGGMLAQIY